MRALFVADYFADTDGDSGGTYPGGAEQTDAAVMEASPWPVERVRTRALDTVSLDRFDLLVLGNLNLATQAQCDAIASTGRHVLFEHDYRMCRYRGDYVARRAHRWLGRCMCRERRFHELCVASSSAIA
jgi:hypothetical protein